MTYPSTVGVVSPYLGVGFATPLTHSTSVPSISTEILLASHLYFKHLTPESDLAFGSMRLAVKHLLPKPNVFFKAETLKP